MAALKPIQCRSCNRTIAYDHKGKRHRNREYSYCEKCGRITCIDCLKESRCRKCREKGEEINE